MTLNEIIEKGNFDEFFFMELDDSEWDALLNEFYKIGVVEENILAYYACCAGSMNNNVNDIYKAKLHYTAAIILTMGINYVEGSYLLGFYHMQQAMKLDSSNIEYKTYTLSTFVISPEIEIERNIVMKIINEVLKTDPQNEIANRILKMF